MMSDSNSDLPPDSRIEQCFRRVVRDALKRQEDITVNSVRAAVEEELEIASDFFKEDPSWKKRSKELINSAIDEPASPEKPSAPLPKSGTKRKSETPQPTIKKRRKKSPKVSEDEEFNDTHKESDHEKDTANGSKGLSIDTKLKQSKKSEDDSSLSEPASDDDDDLASPAAASKSNVNVSTVDAAEDSDLSSVIDVTPPKKKRSQKPASSSNKDGQAKPAKPKVEKPNPSLTSDEEEIKRLQSWLLKCGIRKLWHRELAPYDTAKDKIRHLKNMLTDVGMTGRFSAEKARSIKEARELAAELESAKEFNEHWGHSGGEDNDEDGEDQKGGAPRRRLKPKGLIDFSDSDEGSD